MFIFCLFIYLFIYLFLLQADTRLKLVKLGCFAQVIEYIRGNEDDEAIQALGILVIRILVGNDASLKQLFLAHGGMNLIMALHQYKEGIVKDEAALAMFTFRRGQLKILIPYIQLVLKLKGNLINPLSPATNG